MRQYRMPNQPQKPSARRRTGRHFDVSSLRERIAAIVPEHFGDLFAVALVFALAVGAALFWFFGWLPANTALPQQVVLKNIPFFNEDELEVTVKIIEAREEASTAPVLDIPSRDPFQYQQ